jgi:hypothetical protein
MQGPGVACRQCGTCCVAPDISSLGKPAGIRCGHLDDKYRCRIYGTRPDVCRGYRPDGLCSAIAAPSLEERVVRYLGVFGMEAGEGM